MSIYSAARHGRISVTRHIVPRARLPAWARAAILYSAAAQAGARRTRRLQHSRERVAWRQVGGPHGGTWRSRACALRHSSRLGSILLPSKTPYRLKPIMQAVTRVTTQKLAQECRQSSQARPAGWQQKYLMVFQSDRTWVDLQPQIMIQLAWILFKARLKPGHIRAAPMTGRKFWNILKFSLYCVTLIPVPAAGGRGKIGLFFRGFYDSG